MPWEWVVPCRGQLASHGQRATRNKRSVHHGQLRPAATPMFPVTPHSCRTGGAHRALDWMGIPAGAGRTQRCVAHRLFNGGALTPSPAVPHFARHPRCSRSVSRAGLAGPLVCVLRPLLLIILLPVVGGKRLARTGRGLTGLAVAVVVVVVLAAAAVAAVVTFLWPWWFLSLSCSWSALHLARSSTYILYYVCTVVVVDSGPSSLLRRRPLPAWPSVEPVPTSPVQSATPP